MTDSPSAACRSQKKTSFKDRFRRWLSKTPLWVILTVFLSVILLLLTLSVSVLIFERSYAQTMKTSVVNSSQKLGLKMENLENYIDDLSSFAIQPCYDDSFYHALRLKSPLSETVRESIVDTVSTYYYARRDIRSYEIMILNQNISVGRDLGEEHVRIKACDAASVRNAGYFKACENNVYNLAIVPPEEAGTLFCFYHTLLNLPRQTTALVKIRVDRDMLPEITQTAAGSAEFFCLYSASGELLYSGNEEAVNAKTDLLSRLNSLSIYGKRGAGFVSFAHTRYLATQTTGDKFGMTLVSFVPEKELTSSLTRSRYMVIFESLLIWILALILMFLIIRYFTRPLSVIANKQKDVGAGDLSGVHVAGCREISDLNSSFNEMTRHIDSLIEQNYAASLNEKTARLSALEAQINPHFLYNTLQAIGSEALMNDQPAIYNMLTSLASSMRYSIKAANLVLLRDEINYVNNYVTLMKMRMGERLTVEQSVDPETLNATIPKISIQSLVENSIVHGIGGSLSSIRIRIETFYAGDYLVLRVTDDGKGIPDDELERLRSSFRKQTLQDPGAGIGLPNLYNRIILLYGGDADIQIKSSTADPTFTAVTLILSRERALAGEKEEMHVSGTDH
jgi:two-component system sensor histidine kinase YesM